MKKWIDKGISIYNAHREPLSYIFFGGLTTLINYVVYVAAADLAGLGTTPSVWVAWAVSVAFAYAANRLWVFKSKARGAADVAREAGLFVAARVASLLLDWGIMYLFADTLGYNDKVVKALSNIVVIIINYILSKLIIFAKKES